jgi:integrase
MKKIRVRKYFHPRLKFVVNFREAGRRARKFFETKEEAQAFADLKNDVRKKSGLDGEKITSKLRDMALECAERLSEHGKTLVDATDFFVAHLQATKKSCTAEQLVQKLLAAKKADGVSVRHLNDVRVRLGKFARKFDGQMVATTTTKELDHWLRSLPVSAATRNHYRALLVLAFNFAVREGYATTNPAQGAARAKQHSSDIGILTVTQAACLLESAGPDILPYITIGMFAGLRSAELHRLDWREIDFESGLIEVTARKSKTAQRRFVTIQPNLREWLLPVRKREGSVTPSSSFRQLFEQARKAAGITDWPENALRHSFASYHMAHFKNAASTSLELGHHNSRITFAHYRELVKPKEAERYWEIKPGPVAKVVPMPTHKPDLLHDQIVSVKLLNPGRKSQATR